MELLQRREHEIDAGELADWLERQEPGIYWTVDGDPVLAGRLSVPCPGDEIAAELRKIGRPLMVLEPISTKEPSGASGGKPRLDELVECDELDTRVLQLRWKGSERTWLLIEDEETSESVARESMLSGNSSEGTSSSSSSSGGSQPSSP